MGDVSANKKNKNTKNNECLNNSRKYPKKEKKGIINN